LAAKEGKQTLVTNANGELTLTLAIARVEFPPFSIVTCKGCEVVPISTCPKLIVAGAKAIKPAGIPVPIIGIESCPPGMLAATVRPPLRTPV
jgi:hypothetical protein